MKSRVSLAVWRIALGWGMLVIAGAGLLARAETSATPGPIPASQYGQQTDIPYGPEPQQRLDICAPTNRERSRPAVLLIHGGGWGAGDKRGYTNGLCKKAAARGIVGISIDYRLADGSSARWPVQLIDAQLAMRWVKANAGRLGIDAAKVCALGDSAGGHLAVFLGVLRDDVPGQYSDLYAGVSPQAACIVDQSGPVDLTGSYRFPAGNLFGRGIARDALTQREHEASPIFAVGPQTARMLILHGTQDDKVPFAQAQELYDALKRSGVAAKLISYPGGHDLVGLPRDTISAFQRTELDFIAGLSVSD